MRVLYFAWLRERIGVGSETVDSQAGTPAELMAELAARGGVYADIFTQFDGIRVAVDHEICDWHDPMDGAVEVAFFPPMTGG